VASVIITGNPVDGFQVFGPFTTPEEADRFVTTEVDGIELWVLPLNDPVLLVDSVGEG
jgi:hypothetical protein